MTSAVLGMGFVAAVVVLWLSTLGYLALLGTLAAWRRRAAARDRRGRAPASLPPIAVLVPTLDEERLIGPKLADLARTDYPAGRLRVVVVDGGSRDATVSIVARAGGRHRAQLLQLDDARGQADQVARALARLDEEIVVVTDADSRLDRGCIRRLVETLAGDDRTALVGAAVLPASPLLEERIHWWLQNRLWWLEGEALGAGTVSGVCYAVRRRTVLPSARRAHAEDVHLALGLAARGFRVRTRLDAVAREIRVPRDSRELLRFRHRRGAGYVAELRRIRGPARAAAARGPVPLGTRLARGVRLWHFVGVPRLAAGTALLGAALLATPTWPWVALAAAAFAVPLGTAVTLASLRAAGSGRPWRVPVAAGRLLALLWLALLTLPPLLAPPAAAGSRR